MSNWFKTRNEEEQFIKAYGRANASYSEAEVRHFLASDPEDNERNQKFLGYGSLEDSIVLWDIARKDLQAELELVKGYLETVYEALPDLTSNERIYGTESSVLITDIKEVLGK
jgi:hypothetical protein